MKRSQDLNATLAASIYSTLQEPPGALEYRLAEGLAKVEAGEILPEGHALRERFGEDYERYCRDVSCWLGHRRTK